MLLNKLTNIVYLSKRLHSDERYTKTCNALIEVLQKHGIRHAFLNATKDIWCRDYMPIQIEKKRFVQFRYAPSYLKGSLELQSEPIEICKANNIEPQFSKINLDGGNVVNWTDRAILTDRVFDENPEYSSKNRLISEIENLLEVEVIVIPQIKSDMTGHADGMLRFVDHNTVLGNDRQKEHHNWKRQLNKVLGANGIDYIDIPFVEHKEKAFPDNAIGCYVNYLEVQDLIVLPLFGIDNNKDEEVYEKFRQIFPNRKFETIDYNTIGLYGGLLNCTTWAIEE